MLYSSASPSLYQGSKDCKSPRMAYVMILQIFHTHSSGEPFYFESFHERSALGKNTLRKAAPRIIHPGGALLVEPFGLRTPLLVKIEDPKEHKVYSGL